jgi:hypothetical protein
MNNRRQISLRRALLQSLVDVPAGYLLTDELLRADASRRVVPEPTTLELDAAIRSADQDRLLLGLGTDEGTKWGISDAGRLWLAAHP